MYLESLLVNEGLRPSLGAFELAEQEQVLKEKDMAEALFPATDDSEWVPVQELPLLLQIYLEKGEGKAGPAGLRGEVMGCKGFRGKGA